MSVKVKVFGSDMKKVDVDKLGAAIQSFIEDMVGSENLQSADRDEDLTEGEKLMGVDFNPDGDINVLKAKTDYAGIADNLLDLANDEDATPQIKRMVALALSRLQESQMWAVKAITWPHDN